MSIRWKILLPFILGGIVIIFVFHMLILPHVLADKRQEVLQRETLLLKAVEQSLTEQLASNNLGALYMTVENLMGANRGVWEQVLIYDNQDRQIYPVEKRKILQGEHLLTIINPLKWEVKNFGRVIVQINMAESMANSAKQFHQFMMLAFGLISLSALVVILWLNQSVRIPLFRLQQAARQMADGDFEVDFPKAGRDEMGQLTQMFASMRENLKHSQERLQIALDESTESEIRHKVALNSITEAFITLDYQGRLIGANAACEKMFGCKLEQLRGKTIDSLIIFESGLAERLKWSDADVIGATLECDAKNARGEKFVAEFVINEMCIYGAKNYVMTVRDITSRKKAQQELLTAKESAESASRAKDEFLARMSHELRTPLNAILGFAQIMAMDDMIKNHNLYHDNVEEIFQAGKHLLSLIEEVLDLSKIESGTISVIPIEFECQDMISECVSLLSPLATRKNISVIQILNQPLPVYADYERLKQVVINLLSNAIKYNRQDGQIEIYANQLDDGYYRISIKDTGIGFEEKDYERIFLPFERAVAFEDEIEGSGIGLALSKRIMGLMDGRIGCDSRKGIGSRFWIDVKQAGYDSGTTDVIKVAI